jgi:hypothetical protein
MHGKTSKKQVNCVRESGTDAGKTGRKNGAARVRLSLIYIPPDIFQVVPEKNTALFRRSGKIMPE